jgi:hypothetical protein
MIRVTLKQSSRHFDSKLMSPFFTAKRELTDLGQPCYKAALSCVGSPYGLQVLRYGQPPLLIGLYELGSMYEVAGLDPQASLHQYSRNLSLRPQTRRRECLLGQSPMAVSLRILLVSGRGWHSGVSVKSAKSGRSIVGLHTFTVDVVFCIGAATLLGDSKPLHCCTLIRNC